ncbi:MAG: acetyl-coenzyme A synthetase N-terminal domain-containing protein, partial [Acidobacteriota bacterium]|nr:acetyl-coenzyme A synthetase N-terminal domain-containing protein [Acidobacteriota bacterium]
MARKESGKKVPQVPAASTPIDVLLTEKRKFAPPAGFVKTANAKSSSVYGAATRDLEKFWSSWAKELQWDKPWKKVLEWKPPHAKWFTGGKLNASVNCVDRHLAGHRRTKAAFIWEGEPGDRRTLTYREL